MKKDKEQIVQADAEGGQLAGEAMVEVVENQIADNNPPETKEALERLVKNRNKRKCYAIYCKCFVYRNIWST